MYAHNIYDRRTPSVPLQGTNPDLTQRIEEESRRDPLLMEHLETLKTTLATLDNIVESPRVESVLNVLRYARDTAPAASHG